ncbi:hypothetical protein BN874_1400053 [Candidatus Contendobacter odensis Run_B_J11]|uniref:Uncharacterized protein n=1 Tax=Candidatus Contendobacter odensis Run_B_J11 TaxID=1400861 RepID=A0A7U7G9J7_9GAMM|nr:hypothetical protein BN874_1400053 [Candidatus Contendobacter odensis Run_B_J11]
MSESPESMGRAGCRRILRFNSGKRFTVCSKAVVTAEQLIRTHGPIVIPESILRGLHP